MIIIHARFHLQPEQQILTVMAIAVITAFFVAVAVTIASVICGGEQNRERDGSPRKFWLLLSFLLVGILIIVVLFITLIWSFFV